jgi:hypothetical protein
LDLAELSMIQKPVSNVPNWPDSDRWLTAIWRRLGSNFSLLHHLKRIICPDAKRYPRGRGGTLQSVQSIAALASSMLDAKQPRVQPPR